MKIQESLYCLLSHFLASQRGPRDSIGCSCVVEKGSSPSSAITCCCTWLHLKAKSSGLPASKFLSPSDLSILSATAPSEGVRCKWTLLLWLWHANEPRVSIDLGQSDLGSLPHIRIGAPPSVFWCSSCWWPTSGNP